MMIILQFEPIVANFTCRKRVPVRLVSSEIKTVSLFSVCIPHRADERIVYLLEKLSSFRYLRLLFFDKFLVFMKITALPM